MSDKVKGLYLLLVVLFSGFSISFFRSHEGLIVLFAVGLAVFVDKLHVPSRALFFAYGIWLGYFLFNTYIVGSFHLFFMGTYIANITIAWLLLSHYRQQIFEKYENIIYQLAIISLVFYAWQIAHHSSLYHFIELFDVSHDAGYGYGYVSIIIYSMREFDPLTLLPRNQGFTWEPGPFSCYLAIAVFINLARNKLRLRDKSRLFVFVLGIITTQSTTGIVCLLAIVLWYSWERYKNRYARIVIGSVIAALISFSVISTPILWNKILNESSQDVEEIINNSLEYGVSYRPGRFASFQLAWVDFKNYPIAGIGGEEAFRYTRQRGVEVATISGIGNIMTRYGMIGTALFIILIFRTGKWLTRYYGVSSSLIFPSLILMISFGFGIIETPIVITLWLVPVFLKNPKVYNKETWLKKYYSVSQI